MSLEILLVPWKWWWWWWWWWCYVEKYHST